MNETQRALMEGERNAASDEYFGARPQIDTTDRRRVFEAGFDRAWKALLPTVCDCTTETHADGRQETRWLSKEKSNERRQGTVQAGRTAGWNGC